MHRFKRALSIILTFVYVFTAFPLSFPGSTGITKAFAEPMNDGDAVNNDGIALDALAATEGWENYEGINTDKITLPDEGTNGSTITWTSSDVDLVDTDGNIKKPSYSTYTYYYSSNTRVNLTATITKGEAYTNKQYEITVNPLDITEEDQKAIADFEWVYEKIRSEGWDVGEGYAGDNFDLPLTDDLPNNSTISWESSNPDVVASNGTITRPPTGEGDKSVQVSYLITRGSSIMIPGEFSVNILEGSNEEDLESDKAWLTAERILGENTDENNVIKRIILPTWGEKRSIITWEFSEEGVILPTGAIMRPTAVQGDKTITITANLSRNGLSDTKTFTFTVPSSDATEEATLLEADADWIYNAVFYGWFIDDLRAGSLPLPVVGPNGSTISWASSNPDIISLSGEVNRPDFSLYKGRAPVTLTATVSRRDSSIVKTYETQVYPDNPTDLDRVIYCIDNTLKDEYILHGNDSLYVKTDLYLPTTNAGIYFGDMSIGGCEILWETSHPGVIGVDGTVTRPLKGQPSVTVTLTATITYGAESDVKVFTFIVTPFEVYPLAVNYENFTDTDRLQLNGVAGTVSTTDRAGDSIQALQFRNGTETVGGSVFTKNRIRLGDDLSFSTAFTYRIKNLADYYDLDSNGAFTFTLQGAGSSIYTQSLNDTTVKPSVNIAFTTSRSRRGSGQADSNYVDVYAQVYYNGDYSSATQKYQIGTFKANEQMDYNTIWIEYDGTEKVLELWFSDSGDRPDINYMHMEVEDVDLGEILTSTGDGLTIADVRDVYAGFMGSLGNAREDIEIYEWYFKNDSAPINRRVYELYDVSDITLSAVASANVLQSILTVTVSGVTGPMEGIPVKLFTDIGTLSQPEVITDALGQATFTLTGVSTGVAHVKAVAPGGAMAETEAPLSATDEDAVGFDIDWLLNGAGRSLLLNGNSSLNNIFTMLVMPLEGPNGSAISWSSNSPHVNAANGNVTLPTPEEGNQQVTLTATLSKGTVTRTEQIIVTVRFSDASAVPADITWLDSVVLDENSDWDNIIGNLDLPTNGQYGSSITWTSSNEDIIATNGTVTRPTYTQGDQTVSLTALIRKGSSSDTVSYTATVKALDPNDREAVSLVEIWLTWDIIKGGNPAPNSVTGNLYLPENAVWETDISWTSSNTNFIATNGTVVQPAFSQGIKRINLTATISRGTEFVQKTFEITVQTLPQTDTEAVAADKNWLDISRTLGQNLSEFSIKENLSLPSSAYNGSAVTWSSDMPAFISNGGAVVRPTSAQGHQVVKLTATFSKGSAQETKIFTYTVMAYPDVTPPQMTEMHVTENGTQLVNYDAPFDTPELPWMTSRIYIYFDEVLDYWPGSSGGIRIEGPNTPSYRATTWNNEVIFFLEGLLKPGATYELVIPAHYVGDVYGNLPAEDIRIPVRVEERLAKTIQVISSTPADREREVSRGLTRVTLKLNYSDIVRGENFYNIKVVDEYGIQMNNSNPWISGDEVRIDLNRSLYYDTTYKVIVPAGAITDYYKNQNIEQIIQFRSESYTLLPVIESVYPQSGQTDVDIHQNIDVSFTERTGSYYVRLWLQDETGKNVPVSISDSMLGTSKIYSLVPYQPLKPNTVYTITGDHASVLNPSQMEFSLSFRTGENKLGIRSVSPGDRGTNIPIDKAVEIDFTASPMKGSAFSGIEFTDSDGTPVSFHGEERGNKAILIPDANYDEDKVYFVRIPKGAYQGQGNIVNDEYVFRFKTDKHLELQSDLLSMPSTALVGKPARFNADRIESYIKSENHGVASYQWNFGDGSTGSVKNPEHVFSQTGDYTVTLTVLDNKGFYYEFEQNISILPIHDVKMTVSRSGRNSLYFAQGWPNPSVTYNIRLESENLPIPGETIGVALYKNGILQRTFDDITYNSNNAYTFTYTAEANQVGNYELVFTYVSPSGAVKVREPIRITAYNATSYLRVQLYDRRNGGIYSEATYLNVKVDGNSKVAVREWIPSLNEYVYTVQEQFPILRYYKFQLEGFSEYASDQRIADFSNSNGILYNIGELGDFYSRPPVKSGFKPNFGLNKLVEIDILYKPFLIEGVDMGTTTFAVQGEWGGLTPGYYEIKTTGGKMHKTSTSYRFELRPGTDFKAGDQLMMRMVSSNGISSNWVYWDLNVLPKPKIMGMTPNVTYRDNNYFLSFNTPFGGLMGGGIPLLDDIPYLDGAEFGLGGGMPSFTGIIYKDIVPSEPSIFVEADFNGRAAYSQTNKTSTPFKGKDKIKKVKTIGYEIEIEVGGYFSLFYDKVSGQWKTDYMWISVDGWGSKSWSKGYSIAGIVGVSGKLELGAYVGGTLIIDRQGNGSNEYSGIIRFRPELEVSVTGSYGVGEVGGSVGAYLPAELHLPTGYFQIGFDINAKIWASFLTYTETLYSKKLVSVSWNNGKDKVVYRMMAPADLPDEEISATESTGLKLMDRNYIDRESVWLGGNDSASMFRAGAALRGASMSASSMIVPQSGTLMENIFPNAAVQMVQNGDELWLVWIDDNPDRDAVNRTQLRYSIFKDGTWSEPDWLDDDGTADNGPTMATISEGVLIAWQDISREVSEAEGLSGLLESSEISVSASPYTSGGSLGTVTLTDDEKLDHSPRLAADEDNALLVWTKSDGLIFTLGEDMDEFMAPVNTDSLWFSRWDGSNWSAPGMIQENMPPVLDSSLVMHDDQGLLLYSLDMDNNMSTSEDREIFARLFNGSSWDAPVRLTNNEMNEINPKAAYVDGNWFITWVEDGVIKYRAGLTGQTRTWEIANSVPNDYQLAVLEGENPQVALVYKKTSEDYAQSLYASFYDVNEGVWSGDILLIAEDGYIQNIKPMFTADGKLVAAYTQAEIITEAIPAEIDGEDQMVEQSTVSNKVDLKFVTYTPVHDLAFDEEEGLQLSTGNILPETVVTVFATALNQGDFAEKATIDLYDGNPEDGGTLIASSELLTLPARSYATVEMEWLVPSQERDAYDLYAVINPQGDIVEADETNNTVNLEIKTANVYLDSALCENVAKDDYILNATVVNNGGKTLTDIGIKLVHVESGAIVKSETITKLEPGQEFPVSMLFSSDGLERDEDGIAMMALMAVLPESIREQSTDDNRWEFNLELATITVTGGSPGSDETQVPVDSAITLNFNMNVEEGAGFDGIVLEDEDLNIIEVTGTIEGDTLTITPVSPLANGTHYTLTVPANALGDAYGHTMTGAYTMSFTTTSTYPEVLFSWPSDKMEEVALNADIRLMFNQNTSKGPTYTDIALYGENNRKIPVSISFQDQWLYIKPSQGLGRSTAYTLIVPRGAVANGDQIQQEDFRLEFTTVSTGGNNNNSGDSDQTKSYNANIGAIGGLINVELPVKVNSETGRASIDLGKLTDDIFALDENTVISVPSIPGVNAYTLEIPADSLTGNIGNGKLTFETNVGSITISSGMLSGMTGLDGKIAGINIAAGDKTKLPDDIRETIGNRPLIQLNLTIDGKQTEWNNPSSPVRVSIPYEPSEEELSSPESIVIWYIDGNGHAVSVPNGRYDPVSGTVTFITTHFSDYAIVYNPVSFKDVASDAWYKKAVEFIAARQITSGTGNGNYSPTARITRGEFITLLMRAYEIAPDTNPIDNFDDAGNSYFTGYLAAAKRLGISQGTGKNMFSPGKEITRQEMFTLLYNALKVIDRLPNRLPSGSSGKSLDDFTDANEINSWAKEAFTVLVETGTVVGNNGKLTPNNTATRAEMAQILYMSIGDSPQYSF